MKCFACHGSNPACAFCGGTGTFQMTRGQTATTQEAPKMNDDDALLAWAKAQTWSDFAQSVAAKAAKWGLTPRQREVLESMRAKAGNTSPSEAPAPAAAPNPALAGFDGVEAILQRVAASGNKWPVIRLATEAETPVRLTLLNNGRNAGSTKVELDGAWLGYIKGGVWSPSPVARALTAEGKRDLWALMQDLKADPEKTFAAFGHKTGTCSCCGLPLSNPESVARGIGPICAGKMFGGL